ncbi:MAG: hypothetical protein K940chlam7_02041 [Chlamydiae bacterium]|nr:hypothetical protein [Chlamydiota bacterium]
MHSIVLRNQTPEGVPLEATFLPDKGMNMISYKLRTPDLIGGKFNSKDFG